MKQRLCAVLGVLALAACGSDSPPTGAALCAKAGTVGAALTKKVAACGPSESIGVDSSCTTNLGSCTAADQGILNSILDCFNAAASGAPLTTAQCTSTTGLDLLAQVEACTDSSRLGSLSTACKTAMEIDSSSSASPASCTYSPSAGGTACAESPSFTSQAAAQAACALVATQPAFAGATYQSSQCGATQGGAARAGKCAATVSSISMTVSVYGVSAAAGQTYCTTISGTWTPG